MYYITFQESVPVFAKYRTVDKDGTVRYHEDLPFKTMCGGWESNGAMCVLPPPAETWEDSLITIQRRTS